MKGRKDMTDRNLNKYRIEKVLHEYIRDLPEVRKMASRYEMGLYTFEDVLEEIAYVIRKERG